MNTVDLDGGEFVDSEKFCIPIEQLPLLIDKIGNLLVNLKPELKNPRFVPFYCFRVATRYKMYLEHILRDTDLPLGCSYYETNGNRIFDMRGASGGVVTSCCFYIIVK